MLKELSEDVSLVSQYGLPVVRHRVLQRVRKLRPSIDMQVPVQTLLSAMATAPYHPVPRAVDGPLVLNFLVTSVGTGSGGLRTVMRFVEFLEQRGHTCRLYISDLARCTHTFSEQQDALRKSFPGVTAGLYADARDQLPADACIATAWQTAYPAMAYGGAAARLYLVQDFEPWFYPAGSLATLAQETYRMNFYGIALGDSIADELDTRFNMTCARFPFAVEPADYRKTNSSHRDGIVFYARDSTPRRGYELGMLALEVFHKMQPETPIHLVGHVSRGARVKFPYVAHGHVSPQALGVLYNTCRAALVLSFTNLSLTTLEALACGCQPVVNNSALVRRDLGDAATVIYAEPSPVALATALSKAIREDEPSAADIPTWDAAAAVFERNVIKAVTAGW